MNTTINKVKTAKCRHCYFKFTINIESPDHTLGFCGSVCKTLNKINTGGLAKQKVKKVNKKNKAVNKLFDNSAKKTKRRKLNNLKNCTQLP